MKGHTQGFVRGPRKEEGLHVRGHDSLDEHCSPASSGSARRHCSCTVPEPTSTPVPFNRTSWMEHIVAYDFIVTLVQFIVTIVTRSGPTSWSFDREGKRRTRITSRRVTVDRCGSFAGTNGLYIPTAGPASAAYTM
eukprot:3212918-Prymnesium_polylepis.1